MRFTSFQQTRVPALPARVFALALLIVGGGIGAFPTFAATATASASATIIAPDIVQISGLDDTQWVSLGSRLRTKPVLRIDTATTLTYCVTSSLLPATTHSARGEGNPTSVGAAKANWREKTEADIEARAAPARLLVVLNNY